MVKEDTNDINDDKWQGEQKWSHENTHDQVRAQMGQKRFYGRTSGHGRSNGGTNGHQRSDDGTMGTNGPTPKGPSGQKIF